MTVDRSKPPRTYPKRVIAMAILKRFRTKAGFVLVVVCLARSIFLNQPPHDLLRPDMCVWFGFLLIFGGFLSRAAALTQLQKKKQLATLGVYSLCRHPLYLGSILLAYGFCLLLGDLVSYVMATLYFAVFYTATIIWEEARVAERYGTTCTPYRKETPLLIPLGRFRPGTLRWNQAVSRRVVLLALTVLALLLLVEIMAETISLGPTSTG